ncbi:MAG: tetratricopeptide repeat protein [Acidimicrobiia bacterium]
MRALEEERDFLLRSLDDLERERAAGDLADEDYRALRDDYTARAAAVLRRLAAEDAAPPAAPGRPAAPTNGGPSPAATDGRPASAPGDGAVPAADGASAGAVPPADGASAGAAPAVPGAAAVPPATAASARAERPAAAALDGAGAMPAVAGDGGPQARRRRAVAAGARPAGGRRRWPPVAVGAVLLAFASAAGLLVARSAGERLPGEAASGDIAATGPAAGIAAELVAARDLIGAGRTLDAVKAYDRILEQDPDQPEALAYRGWLVRLAGRAAGDRSLIDRGMELIERAVATDPGYPDARFFRAFVNYQDRGDPAAAVPDLRAYLAGDAPEAMVPVVEDLLRRALADVERGAPSPAPVPAPPATTAPPPAPAG